MAINADPKNYWHQLAAKDAIFAPETHFDRSGLICFRSRFENIPAMLEHAVESSYDAEAIVYEDTRLNYGQLQTATENLARGLSQLGVAQGSRFGILMSNRTEFVVSLLAGIRLGAIAVPVNVRLQSAEIQYVVEHSGMQVLLLDYDGYQRFAHSATKTGLKHIIATADVFDEHEASSKQNLLNYAAVADSDHQSLPSVTIDEHDPALLMYTSGTTGRPKGAIVTHLGIIHAAKTYAWTKQLGPAERSIMAVPASHITGITANIFNMIGVGGCCIIMNQFKADDFVQTAAAEKITHTVIVPAMYKLCLLRTTLSDFDLSSWRIGGYGGAPMPESTILELAQQLPNLGLFNIYGSTETTGPVVMMPPGHTAGRGDSIGQMLPTSDIKVVDANGTLVSPNESGELIIRGPSVIPGYWNDEQANLENFKDGGWCSGDIVQIDSDGYIRIIDRLKDVINRGGYKVYSIEVENCLDFHPQVIESAVVARPDEVLGEKTHAHVRSASSTLSEAQLREHCAQRLADYKVPDFYTITDQALPRNANGKLLKKDLRLVTEQNSYEN